MATTQRNPAESLLSLPNQLSISRVFLAVVLFVLIALEMWVGCLLVTLIATATDWLDGYIARRQGLVSDVGRQIDPLADKVLMCGAFIFLLPLGTAEGWLAPWMVTVIVIRELAITGLRGFVEQRGLKFGADWLGKLKMALQCAALLAIFTSLCRFDVLSPWAGTIDALRLGLVWAMVIATILSGLQYLLRVTVLFRA